MILKEKSCKESFEDLQADHFKIWEALLKFKLLITKWTKEINILS
jgi:hypothetical protein